MPKIPKPSKKYTFVSYSTRETHTNLLLTLLWVAFSERYDVKLTPSALKSGSSQLNQILQLAQNCSFAVVVLDGLRPNVVFEYGLLRAFNRPIILIKEKKSSVDVQSLFGDPARPEIPSVSLNINEHFSDVKDENYAEWDASDPAKTVKLLWEEYRKKEKEVEDYVPIKEPKLW